MAATVLASPRIEPPLEPVERYGLLAEFTSASDLLRATRRAYAEGYRYLDAYSPFPVDGLSDALDLQPSRIPLIGLIGGVVGLATGLSLQYWIHVVALPLNVGGRPLDSWPAFVPVVFELTVLFSALAMLAGLFVLNGHPQPYHPIFNVAAFASATRDRFFLSIEQRDPRFDRDRTRAFLLGLGATEVADVLA